VLLTFDDGPDPTVTPAVLERLAAHDVHAVFFIAGEYVSRAPHLLERIVEGGHVIGNHGYTHVHNGSVRFLSLRRDLLRCQATIADHTGRRPSLFRPPFGRVSAASLLMSRSLGLRTLAWSLDPRDWACSTPEDAEASAAALLAGVRARDIILLHDDHPHILAILDRVLPALRERDFDLRRGVAMLGIP